MLIITPAILEAQELRNKLEMHASVNYTYLGRSTYDFFITGPTQEIQIQTRTKFLPSIEVGAGIQFREHFSLEANLTLVNNGHDTRRLSIPSFKESFHSYDAYFLSFGVGARFNTGKFLKRFDFEIIPELIYNQYLTEKSNEPEFTQTNIFNWKSYLSAGGKLGFGYHLQENKKLSFGFDLETNLTETTKVESQNDSVDNDFLRVGLYLRFSYSFKK